MTGCRLQLGSRYLALGHRISTPSRSLKTEIACEHPKSNTHFVSDNTWRALGDVAAHLVAMPMDRTEYLLAELRCAWLRTKLIQADIHAIGIALKGGLITPEQAIVLLGDCDALRYVEPTAPQAMEAA